jgi:hypothetical protein
LLGILERDKRPFFVRGVLVGSYLDVKSMVRSIILSVDMVCLPGGFMLPVGELVGGSRSIALVVFLVFGGVLGCLGSGMLSLPGEVIFLEVAVFVA